MVLTVVSVLFIALFSYVNLTVGRNFNFKPDLTLIQATPQPCITLESVRLLEKTLEMLGIEPGSYCLAARNFTTLVTVASVYLIALFSYVNLTVAVTSTLNPNFSHTATIYNIKKCTVVRKKPCNCWESNLVLTV